MNSVTRAIEQEGNVVTSSRVCLVKGSDVVNAIIQVGGTVVSRSIESWVFVKVGTSRDGELVTCGGFIPCKSYRSREVKIISE